MPLPMASWVEADTWSLEGNSAKEQVTRLPTQVTQNLRTSQPQGLQSWGDGQAVSESWERNGPLLQGLATSNCLSLGWTQSLPLSWVSHTGGHKVPSEVRTCLPSTATAVCT